jgi:mono/diheme cytochrome c family protein
MRRALNVVTSSPRVLLATWLAATACTVSDSADASVRAASAPAPPDQYALGTAVDSAELRRIDIDVDPSGVTLPAGSGTAAKGYLVYVAKCASCHGAKGEGIGPAVKLVGRDPRDGFPFGRDVKLVKTVGNYWSNSTTLYDYVQRAMPLTAPGSLTPDEVYAVIAWILAENEIIPRDAVVSAKTLPAVKMPAAGRFVRDDRQGKSVR